MFAQSPYKRLTFVEASSVTSLCSVPPPPKGEDNSTVGASTLSKFTVKALALGELPLDGEAGLGTASAFSSLMRCTRGNLAFYEFIHAY